MPLGFYKCRGEMEKSKIAALKRRLEEERRQLLAKLAQLDSKAYSFGEWDKDEIDVAASILTRESELWRVSDLQRRLRLTDDALRRIDQGTYGRCERCGEEIDPARLEILPYTTLCVKCKQKSG